MVFSRPIAILSTAALVVVLSGCPSPFGYYSAGNELVKQVETSETAAAVPTETPNFLTAPTEGGTPVPVSGTVEQYRNQKISLECGTEGALIFYTYSIGTVGVPEPPDPDPYKPSTHLYKPFEPILVTGDATHVLIKAVAFMSLKLPSSIANLDMTISYTKDPTFSVPSGTYQTSISVTMTAPTSGSVIWYTTSGSPPVPEADMGFQVASPYTLTISSDTTLQAVAVMPDGTQSAVAVASYRFAPFQPQFSTGTSGVSSVILSWNPVATATSYNIYYRQGTTVSTSTGTQIHNVASPHTVAGLTGGSQYAFIVTAVNTNGESLPSAIVTVTPLLPSPSGLTVVSASTQAVYAKWSPVSGADHYEVYTDTSSTGSFTMLAWSGTATGAIVGTFAAGSINYFKVRSVDVAGNPGPLSAAVPSATFTTADMPVPASIATGSYPAPTQLPATAPSPDYWIRTVTLAFTQGAYTYLVWDRDYQNWSAFAIAAYDSSQNLVAQWVISGNRYISSFSIDPFSGDMLFVGQSTTSTVPWRSLKL